MFLASMTVVAVLAQGMPFDEPPEGWRAPTSEELDGNPLRARSPNAYVRAEADFDGDGRTDYGALFSSSDGTKEALFVRMSSLPGREWIQAAEVGRGGPSNALLMGVALAAPGVHRTACGKGYWECAEDEPAELRLERPGLRYFVLESAESIIYWDVTSGEFEQVWISD